MRDEHLREPFRQILRGFVNSEMKTGTTRDQMLSWLDEKGFILGDGGVWIHWSGIQIHESCFYDSEYCDLIRETFEEEEPEPSQEAKDVILILRIYRNLLSIINDQGIQDRGLRDQLLELREQLAISYGRLIHRYRQI